MRREQYMCESALLLILYSLHLHTIRDPCHVSGGSTVTDGLWLFQSCDNVGDKLFWKATDDLNEN